MYNPIFTFKSGIKNLQYYHKGRVVEEIVKGRNPHFRLTRMLEITFAVPKVAIFLRFKKKPFTPTFPKINLKLF